MDWRVQSEDLGEDEKMVFVGRACWSGLVLKGKIAS
jgi:hypothetical protein